MKEYTKKEARENYTIAFFLCFLVEFFVWMFGYGNFSDGGSTFSNMRPGWGVGIVEFIIPLLFAVGITVFNLFTED